MQERLEELCQHPECVEQYKKGAAAFICNKYEYKRYRDYFLDQLEFDILLANHPYDGEVLNEILELLVETVCSKRQYLHVCGEDKPA